MLLVFDLNCIKTQTPQKKFIELNLIKNIQWGGKHVKFFQLF